MILSSLRASSVENSVAFISVLENASPIVLTSSIAKSVNRNNYRNG